MIRYQIIDGEIEREYGFGNLPTQENGNYDRLVNLIKANDKCVLKLTNLRPSELPVKEIIHNIKRRVDEKDINLGTYTLSAQLVDVPHRSENMYVLFSKVGLDTNQEALFLLSEGDAF